MQLDFEPTSSLHEAGLTVFLSTWYHNEIGITLHPNTGFRTIFAKIRTGANAELTITYADISTSGPVKLFIKAEPHQYSLGYSVGSGEPIYIASLDSRWLQAFVSG